MLKIAFFNNKLDGYVWFMGSLFFKIFIKLKININLHFAFCVLLDSFPR